MMCPLLPEIIVIYTAREVDKFYKLRIGLRPRRSRWLAIELSETYQVFNYRAVYYVF